MDLEFPQELLDYFESNKSFGSVVHSDFLTSKRDTECKYYPIKFDIDVDQMLKECQGIEGLYFNHRGNDKDKQKGYGHRGWQSITLHGIDEHKTEHYDKYGFTSLDDANYRWTDVCDRLPSLVSFLKSLPYSRFERVRIMRLAPKGYIMPHSDNKHQRAFSPLNIAINNPSDCYFVFKEKGIVPFKAGMGFVLDVGHEHMVINFSDEVRYHIIVHGHMTEEFSKL